MLGGEMLTWSDRHTRGGAFRGALGPALVDRLPEDSRVLLVGPHDAGVARVLAGRSRELHVLERSYPDALDLRDELAGEAATVFCGPVRRFLHRPDRYDAVVALDGLDRLEGTDFEPLGWREILAGLTGILAPGGSLLLGVPNPLGLGRLLAPTAHEAEDDAAWPRPVGVTASPAGLADVVETCRSAGLPVRSIFAAYPDAHSPTLLVGTDVLDRFRGDDRLVALIDDALRSAIGSVPLKDPRELSRLAVRAGVAEQLAPGWILECGPEGPQQGVVLVGEPSRADGLSAAYALAASGMGAWERRLLASPTATAGGPVARDHARLAAPLSPGTLLEQALLNACAARDREGVRALVRAWADWLRSGPDLGRGGLAFATTDNVITHGGSFDVVDPSWRLATDPSPDVAVVCGLTGFVRRLLTSQMPSPWPVGTAETRLVATLATAAGLDTDEYVLEAGARLATVTERVIRESLDPEAPAGPVPITSIDGAAAALARLTTELRERDAQIEWLIGRIHRRELEVQARRKANARLRGSAEYRLGSLLLAARNKLRARRKDKPAHEWRREPKPVRRGPRDPALLPPGYRGPGVDGGTDDGPEKS